MGTLLSWAIAALIISLIAGALGLSGIAAGAAVVAKLTFGLFLFIALVLFIMVAMGIGAARSL